MPHSPFYWLALFLVGVVVGCFGTLIGAGGGFILMPILVLAYPNEDPETLTSISLAVVFCNAASGSVGYAFQRRIDYRAGLLFSAAAVPGAVIGALATGSIPRRAFDGLLGLLLVAASVFLTLSGAGRAARVERAVLTAPDTPDPGTGAPAGPPRIPHHAGRGAAISFGVGFLSSLLGIGGGIIHVPALVLALNFPVHVATATSHFVLAITALAGTGTHVASGSFTHGWRRTGALGLGVVIGAQIGARLARRARPAWIIRSLAIALAVAGLRIVYAAVRRV